MLSNTEYTEKYNFDSQTQDSEVKTPKPRYHTPHADQWNPLKCPQNSG